MIEAIEITSFRLTGDFEAFVAANVEVDAWLARQPGFRSRRIAQRDDGTVVDVLVWASVADGVAAADRLMDELAEAPVHALIDQGTVSWTVSPVLHKIGGDA
jgi:hypothetical protein